MLRMESLSLMAWRHFLHRATDEWTYRLERERQRDEERPIRVHYWLKLNEKTRAGELTPVQTPNDKYGKALRWTVKKVNQTQFHQWSPPPLFLTSSLLCECHPWYFAAALIAPSSGRCPAHHPFWAPSHMVGRALLILRTSPSDGSESSGKEVPPSCPKPLDQRR